MSMVNPLKTEALIDASSAILLCRAELILACCSAYQLLMTPSVFSEIAVAGQPGSATLSKLTRRRGGITLLSDPSESLPDKTDFDLGRLHRGERDTLQHYLTGTGRFVVIDDGKGVQVCRSLHIPHVNALLVPSLLYFSGHLSKDDSKRFFRRIQRLGRYSIRVVQWALHCTRENVSFFIDDRSPSPQSDRICP
jgi:hypothetical protein